MSLTQEILVHLLENQQIEMHIPALSPEMLAQMVESVCYQTLQQILEIVHDDSLDDAPVFSVLRKSSVPTRRSVLTAEAAMTFNGCAGTGVDSGAREDVKKRCQPPAAFLCPLRSKIFSQNHSLFPVIK